MTPVRVLICEDEPIAVSRLTSLCERLAGVEVVATSTSAIEAIDLVHSKHPDLLLLDIEMPDLDGFDVVEALSLNRGDGRELPLYAFVTGYRRFASQAFEIGATDFLAKPVRLARLEQAIVRARQVLDGIEARRRLTALDQMATLAVGHKNEFGERHVWISRRGEVVRVELNSLDRIAAEGAYVRLFGAGTCYLHREPIGSIESKLDPAKFVRVHRSHLVRVDQVRAIRRTEYGASELVLKSGDHIPVGRKYAKTSRERFFAAGSEMPHSIDVEPYYPSDIKSQRYH